MKRKQLTRDQSEAGLIEERKAQHMIIIENCSATNLLSLTQVGVLTGQLTVKPFTFHIIIGQYFISFIFIRT